MRVPLRDLFAFLWFNWGSVKGSIRFLFMGSGILNRLACRQHATRGVDQPVVLGVTIRVLYRGRSN